MEHLKIAYIAYYNLNKDTAATEHILSVVNGLSALGHQIDLIIPRLADRKPDKRINIIETGSKISILFDIAASKKINKAYDIVYIRDYMGANKLINAIKKRNIPICIEHNGLILEEAMRSQDTKYKILAIFDSKFTLPRRLKKADVNIAVTPTIGEYYVKKYNLNPNNFIHIPNGVDIKRFHPEKNLHSLRRDLELIPENDFWIGYIGSMFPWHMFETLIGGFELLASQRKDVMLFLGGSGPELGLIKKIIKGSEYANRVKLISPLKISESHKYIRALDIGIALMDPAIAKFCWQVKINHNAASGIPTIITHADVFNDLEKSGVAVGLKKLTKESFAKAIDNLIVDHVVKDFGYLARIYVEQNLSWDIIVDKISNLLISVVGGKKWQM